MNRGLWKPSLAFCVLLSGCHGLDEHIPSEMAALARSQPLANEKSLEASIRFGVGRLEVSQESGATLYTVDLEYDKANYKPEINYDAAPDGRLSVTLDSSRKMGFRTQSQSNRMRLSFHESVPLKLSINTGVGEARLSLSRLRITSLELESGVGGSRLTTYDPNPVVCDRVRIRNGVGSMDAVGLGNLNFREFDFEGGVGGANLDFTGQWKQNAEVRIQVGVGGVTVKMPRDIGVEVDAEKHFLSGIHLERFVKRNRHYYSENYDSAKYRVSLRVVTGVGGFRINWV